MRGFLGQVRPDAALDHPVFVLTREFAGVGIGVQVRLAVGVALERDGGHGDSRKRGVVVRGDVEGREFIAFWLKDGRVLAGMNVNIWGVTDSIKNLIRSGHPVAAAALADASTPLDDLAAGERPPPPVDLAGQIAAAAK